MKTRKIQAAMTAIVCITLGIAGCAAKEAAPPPPPPPPPPVAAAPAPLPSGTIGENLVTATAKVKAIDQKTRTVTLQRQDGSQFTFHASDQIRNLKHVKKGDTVTVSYYESLAYEVMRPGDATPGAAIAEQVGRAKEGSPPAAAGARVMTVTATIMAVDKSAGTVTLRGPEGKDSVIKVRYPEKLNHVAVGDLVNITYTEALGVSVETPKKKKK